MGDEDPPDLHRHPSRPPSDDRDGDRDSGVGHGRDQDGDDPETTADGADGSRRPVPRRRVILPAASAEDGVTGLAQGSDDLGAVRRPFRLQVQLDLRLGQPEPRVGPHMAHVQHISVDH